MFLSSFYAYIYSPNEENKTVAVLKLGPVLSMALCSDPHGNTHACTIFWQLKAH